MTLKKEIGAMRAMVKFEINSNKSAMGAGFFDGYEEFLTTWGELSKSSGYRSLSFGELQLNSQWKCRVRFQVALETKLAEPEGTSIRLVIDNRIFSLDSFELEDGKRSYYIFNLNEAQQ